MIQILFAVLAGLLTITSPCVLPVLPIVLGSSVGQKSKARPALIALGFIISFSVLSLLFATFTKILGISQNNLRSIGIIFLLILGLLLLFPRIFEKLTAFLNPYINKVSSAQSKMSGKLGALLIGLTIGLIWTPCAGPVLAAILTLIATTKNFSSAAILLIFYAIGAGIPMMLIAYGGQYFTTKFRAIAKYSRTLQQVFAVLILLLAVAMYFNYDTLIQAKISSLYPSLANPKY